MDALSPQSNQSTVSSTAQDKSKQQLTYTTVGSIYNPNATAQIQPPTRRPRTRRYPHPLDSPGFGLESELLSSLPLKESAPVTPPTTASVFQQYTPLQQNYDRAVNPAETNPTDLERSVLSSLGMPLPTIRSGNLPPPSGLDDDDSVASEDTLATSRINVKGLTNLASYPNPMQKAAQKALARARPANLSLSRPKTPPSLTYTGFSRERMPPTHTAAASVTTGAPQPLTAGPPGRRERRPGAFEDAIRAARFEKLSEEAPGPSSMRAGYMPRSSAVGYGTTYDSVKNSSQSFPSLNNEFPVAHGPISQGIARPPAAKQSNSPTTPIAQLIGSDGHYRRVYDAAPVGQDVQTYTNSSNYVELGRRRGEDDDWYTQSVIAAARQEDPFSRSIDPVEHRRQLNCAFYAGTKGLVKDISQVEHEYHYRRLVDKIGVIGGERHRLGDSHIDSLGEDGKVQLRPLSIKEASQMPESEHVKPLLSLAYAAMLNYREDGRSGRSDRDGWGPKFREVDDAWVDNSEEGNKSLFDKPKEPPKKKKLVVKKTKLGY
ncbi:hypothetical protein QBC38DRAFT_352567 [Podospora fimiseda]|uniref:Uncharacterized protein n=1 Tax=Podospora fimiseda TaxID=252190 RepID=A0AAN7H2H0_9PEZI|nr:hypothetical protein QBC38DRAFT_352567 [Podospora fimiseda]